MRRVGRKSLRCFTKFAGGSNTVWRNPVPCPTRRMKVNNLVTICNWWSYPQAESAQPTDSRSPIRECKTMDAAALVAENVGKVKVLAWASEEARLH